MFTDQVLADDNLFSEVCAQSLTTKQLNSAHYEGNLCEDLKLKCQAELNLQFEKEMSELTKRKPLSTMKLQPREGLLQYYVLPYKDTSDNHRTLTLR